MVIGCETAYLGGGEGQFVCKCAFDANVLNINEGPLSLYIIPCSKETSEVGW